jgi:regulator of RNase E activity RraA
MTELSPTIRDALLRVGTSTLTGILSRRGLRNMFLQEVWPIRPAGPRMVGPAFTMRFIPAREDKTAAAGRGPVQQRAIEECPPGHVLVVRRPRRSAGGLGWRHLLRPPEGAGLRRHRHRWRVARHRGRL